MPSESTLTELPPLGSGPPKAPLPQKLALGFSRVLGSGDLGAAVSVANVNCGW